MDDMNNMNNKNDNDENESNFWSDALDDIMRRRAWKKWMGELWSCA